MKTQLSIQMRILGLKDLASSLAQPLYDLVFGDANLQPTISANLLSEGRHIPQPGTALAGHCHQAIDHSYWVSLLFCGQRLQVQVLKPPIHREGKHP